MKFNALQYDAALKAYLSNQSKKDLPGSKIDVVSTAMAPLDEPSLNIVHTSWNPEKMEITHGYDQFGSEAGKNRWKDPEYRRKMSEAHKKGKNNEI